MKLAGISGPNAFVVEEASAHDPMVSIVIPVYNGADYLREAIDSALAQTYRNIEIIVVNDGSTDDGATRDVALSYGGRIKYLEKDNGGVATALNLGVHEMRGEYLSWLSHDDVYKPDKIARQIAHLEASGDDKTIPFCNCDFIDHSSQVIGTGAVNGSWLDHSILLIIGTCVGGCSLLIPKTAFAAAGLFNDSLRNCQDNEMWLRMAMKGYRLQYMPDALIKSRIHPAQGSHITSTRHAQERRAFYLWAVTFVGRHNRLAYADELFKILLMKRFPSAASRLFRLLGEDRSVACAVSSLCRGLLATARSLATGRRATALGVPRLLNAIKRRRFRSSSHYWQERYRRGETSGVGSYGVYAEYKAEVLNGFVAANGILRVAEFGCGDGNQLRKFRFPNYLGLDISQAAIDMCRVMFRDDASKRFLVDSGRESIEAIRQFEPELTLSLDVIYHLVENAVFEQYMENLFNLSSRFVVIYSTNFDRRYDFCHQVDRKFTDYVEKSIKGWKLVDALPNPHRGVETRSEFYIYERTAVAARPPGTPGVDGLAAHSAVTIGGR